MNSTLNLKTQCLDILTQLCRNLEEPDLEDFMVYGRIATAFGVPHPEIVSMDRLGLFSVLDEFKKGIYLNDLVPLSEILSHIDINLKLPEITTINTHIQKLIS